MINSDGCGDDDENYDNDDDEHCDIGWWWWLMWILIMAMLHMETYPQTAWWTAM